MEEEEILVPVEEVIEDDFIMVDYQEIMVNRLDFIILLLIFFLAIYLYQVIRRPRT